MVGFGHIVGEVGRRSHIKQGVGVGRGLLEPAELFKHSGYRRMGDNPIARLEHLALLHKGGKRGVDFERLLSVATRISLGAGNQREVEPRHPDVGRH